MTTMEDIKRTAENASEASIEAIYDLDETFNRDLEQFIGSNMGRLYTALKAYSEDEIIEAAKDIEGHDVDDYDEAFEIVGREAEDEFAYHMESWWDDKLAELKNEATTPKAGMTRVYRVYATDTWRDNEWTEYVGMDYEKAREAAIDEDDHLTKADNKVVIFAYNDYKTEEVMNLSDEEIKDLMEGAEGEYTIAKGVWYGQA